MADRVVHVVCLASSSRSCRRSNYTSILQPVKRLGAFQRVTLTPGHSKTVTFTLVK